MARARAVFFDRDGTLVHAIQRTDFPKAVTAPFNFEELRFYDRAFHVLNALRKRGFKVLMVTNQPDVAHGYLSQEMWERVHGHIVYVLQFQPDEVFLCRHTTADGCGFKKPSHLMLQYAACHHNIDLKTSFMVGDMDNDARAGSAAGCKTILIQRPYNTNVVSDLSVPDLFSILELIK